ncbi:Histone-lysine N-methyltransferase [Handroanthus impetiginosus]|uniref:Histone-lysine N-methyltransferase n=1 Tax=Handroanthus impetiginosus TaxID=429701 RepID=A0A2G9HSI0_9LAMI|nr:Histone-lysine N-methyltransferase [Handroanthus impetiginosus]
MAPRRRRPKVGLTRMHAALDAMRPMGFSRDVVRKCVKNLLKVYGDDGWAFIEEAAYRLLIDTILEEPEVSQLEHAPEKLLLEDVAHKSYEPESVPELCDKEVIYEEKTCALNFHGDDINIERGKSQEQDLAVEVSPILLQGDVKAQRKMGLQLSFTPSSSPTPQPGFFPFSSPAPQLGFTPSSLPTPQPIDGIPRSRKSTPCYGWISDDEDDDSLQLIPASNIDN